MAVSVTKQNTGSLYTWDEAAYSWDSTTATKPWDTLYPSRHSVAADDRLALAASTGKAARSRRSFTAALRMGEASQKRPKKQAAEVIAVAEQATRTIRFVRQLAEAAALAGSVGKHSRRGFCDSVALVSSAVKRPGKGAVEMVAVEEAAQKAAARLLLEGLCIEAEAEKATVKGTFTDGWSMEDCVKERQIGKQAAEAMEAQETARKALARPLAAESLVMEEEAAKHPVKPFDAGFGLSGVLFRDFTKRIEEALPITETLLREAVYRRLRQEQIGAVEELAKLPVKELSRQLEIAETYLRNANAVLSDLYYSSQPLSFAAFQKLEAPVRYQPFRDFVIGDYSYEEALFRMLVEGAVMADRPLVTDWRLNVDVPDVSDRGMVEVPEAGLRIDFKKRFYAVPEVNVAVRGGLGATPEYEVDVEGFTVQLRKADGTLTAGTISWSANGY